MKERLSGGVRQEAGRAWGRFFEKAVNELNLKEYTGINGAIRVHVWGGRQEGESLKRGVSNVQTSIFVVPDP